MATEPLDARMARLEGAYDQIDKRLATVEGRLANVEAKIDRVDAKIDMRFDALRGEITGVDGKIDMRFDALNGKIDRVLWVVVIGLLTAILVNLII